MASIRAFTLIASNKAFIGSSMFLILEINSKASLIKAPTVPSILKNPPIAPKIFPNKEQNPPNTLSEKSPL